MKLISRWTKDKKGKMVSNSETGRVSITRNPKREKPYRLYVAWCSKGRFSTLSEVFDKIEAL